jgi:hypothetical protein
VHYYDFVSKPDFFSFLLEIDRSIAAEAHGQPCTRCGGKLDVGNFRRSGYGLPGGTSDECCIRFSFCCREDGCRGRETPESLRFLWGKAYVSIVVVLMSALRHGLSPARVKALTTSLKVSRQTVANWLKWWRERFSSTSFWKAGRAGFMPSLDEAKLPLSLLEVFGGEIADTRERVKRLLRFLARYPRTPR